MRRGKNPEEKYFGLISVLFFLETRRKSHSAALTSITWSTLGERRREVRKVWGETLKQEVALSYCLHNEGKFNSHNVFLVAKNVQNNLAYLGFFSRNGKKKTKIWFLLVPWLRELAERVGIYYLYFGVLSVNTILAWGCWLYKNNVLFFLVVFVFRKKSCACYFASCRSEQHIDWHDQSEGCGSRFTLTELPPSSAVRRLRDGEWKEDCCEMISVGFSGFPDSHIASLSLETAAHHWSRSDSRIIIVFKNDNLNLGKNNLISISIQTGWERLRVWKKICLRHF